MYLSLAMSLMIHEGMFYWMTGAKEGPKFSQVPYLYIFLSFSHDTWPGIVLTHARFISEL